MRRDHWIRGDDETAAFDWRRPARELEVPLDTARALYVRAPRLATDADPRRAELLYLRWLRATAAARHAAPPPPPPGRWTQVQAAGGDGRAWQPRALAQLGPGKWTRELIEARDDDADARGLPGRGEVERAVGALASGDRSTPRAEQARAAAHHPPSSAAALREFHTASTSHELLARVLAAMVGESAGHGGPGTQTAAPSTTLTSRVGRSVNAPSSRSR